MSDADRTTLRGQSADEGLTVLRPQGAAPGASDTVLSPTEITSATPRQTPATMAGVGSVVHDWYRLDHLLGMGAMGTVWKACDLQRARTNDPNPFVALKLVGEDFAGHEQAMIALAREAKKARELAHPNIATVYVFAVDPATGQAYLAMELLEGQPLDRLVREHPAGLDRVAALDIVRGLARGLSYAHSKGIVHCDFKPGNAFLTTEGVPKILDFGIARLAQEVARAGDSFDAGELMALTPAYAAMEMHRDAPHAPHPADDVYALGLVAYELLTGHHPFDGKSAPQVQAESLRPKPVKGLRRREWRAIEKALGMTRAERWPDAQAFLRELDSSGPIVAVMGALVATTALVAGYAWYQNHLAALPAQAFAELSPDVQEQFRAAMKQGDYAYAFATGTLQGDEALAALYRDAILQYAEAYSLHPRNETADAALRRALGSLESQAQQADADQRAEARAVLQDYQRQYPELANYRPLQQAIDQIAP